jgi:hypothetical protein
MTVEILLELPPEIDLDGVFDEPTGIEYMGKAVRNNQGKYVCLAKVPNHGGSELCRVEVTVRPKLPLLEGQPPPPPEHPNVAAVTIRELSDRDLLTSLKNVGCYIADCDACAEVFFTGSKTHDHTCPRGT